MYKDMIRPPNVTPGVVTPDSIVTGKVLVNESVYGNTRACLNPHRSCVGDFYAAAEPRWAIGLSHPVNQYWS